MSMETHSGTDREPAAPAGEQRVRSARLLVAGSATLLLILVLAVTILMMPGPAPPPPWQPDLSDYGRPAKEPEKVEIKVPDVPVRIAPVPRRTPGKVQTVLHGYKGVHVLRDRKTGTPELIVDPFPEERTRRKSVEKRTGRRLK